MLGTAGKFQLRKKRKFRQNATAFTALIASPVTNGSQFTLPGNAMLIVEVLSNIVAGTIRFDHPYLKLGEVGDPTYVTGTKVKVYGYKGQKVTANPTYCRVSIDKGLGVIKKIAGG